MTRQIMGVWKSTSRHGYWHWQCVDLGCPTAMGSVPTWADAMAAAETHWWANHATDEDIVGRAIWRLKAWALERDQEIERDRCQCTGGLRDGSTGCNGCQTTGDRYSRRCGVRTADCALVPCVCAESGCGA